MKYKFEMKKNTGKDDIYLLYYIHMLAMAKQCIADFQSFYCREVN